MYEIYIDYLKTSIELLEYEIQEIKKNYNVNGTIFNPYKHIIEKYVNYDDVLNGLVSEIPFDIDVDEKTTRYINILIKGYYELHRPIQNKQKQINILRNQIINQSIYNYIIKEYNKKIALKMVKENYVIHNHYIGKLEIKRLKRKKPAIDWGKSNKFKQNLIEEGKTLYSAEDKIKFEKENKEYNGVSWLIPHSEENLTLVYTGVNNGYYFNLNKLLRFKIGKSGNNAQENIFRLMINEQRLPNFDYTKYKIHN